MTGNRLIPCLVFVIALAAGTLAASEMTCPFFYQPMMQDMVMWSCGHGLATPASDIPELTDFLACRQETFPCAAIPDTIETRPAGVFVRMHLYLTMAIGLFWRAFGVSYASLFPLFGLMHGLYVLAVYLLARQFFNRWAAAGVSLILAFSPVALGMLFFLRDYSKAPFIIGALALLLFTLRRPTLRGAALAAAAAGAVVGVGIGFRSDCLLLLPIGCGVLAIGLVSARGWRGTAACVLSFAAVALLAGAPIFSASQGGMFGCFAMQGATDPFQRFLDMGDTPYSLGWRYSDELTLSCVAVDMPSPEPGRDAEDGRAPGSPPLAGSQSVTYLSRWAHLFAADFATRALKSVAWIAGFETLARPGHLLSDPGGPSRSITRTGTLLDPVLRPLGASWMPWLGCAGLLALLLRVYARSPRESLALAFAIACLAGYPSFQFSVRHLFHLQVLQWLGLFALAASVFEWRTLRAAAPKFALWAGLCLALGGGVYAFLMAAQDRGMKSEIAALLSGPREPVPFERQSDAEGRDRVVLPVPENRTAILRDRPDDLSATGGTASRVVAAADRLAVTIGGDQCPGGTFSLEFSYDKGPQTWQPLDHTIQVPAPGPGGTTTVIAPAFYRATQHIGALVVPAGRGACIVKVERLPMGMPGLPIGFVAVLPPDWRERDFHQGFGGFPGGE